MDQNPKDRVEQALNGQISPGLLVSQEQEEYLERFSRQLWEPSPLEHEFFAQRRRRGLGVGLNAGGELVHQAPWGHVEPEH